MQRSMLQNPFDIKVMKTDLQMYVQSDEDILRLQNKIGYYETCVGLLQRCYQVYR